MSEKRFETITDNEIKAKGVQSLPIRPNASSQYGQGGLNGKQLQARFDRLAAYIIEKYNALVDGLAGHDVLDYFKLPEGYALPEGYELSTLSDLLSHITDEVGDLVVESPYIEGKEKVAKIIEKLKKDIDICKASIEGITFEGLPDKPFGGTPALNLTVTYNKGYVTLSNGGRLYFQTDETRTADELVGGTVSVQTYGVPGTETISRSSIADESSDGIVLSSDLAYIYVVYNTEYVPTESWLPTPVSAFPSIGIYFYRDPYGDREVTSLETRGNIKPIDNVYIDLKSHPDYSIKLYKHNVYINSGRIKTWSDEAKIYLSYVSTSDTPITTLAELINSPAVAKQGSDAYLNYAYANYLYRDELNGTRDVDRIRLTDKKIFIDYIEAYTVPVTYDTAQHEHDVNYMEVIITDTVTEV